MMRPGWRQAYRLAARLGRWDVDALLAEMPAKAFLGWIAFERAEAGVSDAPQSWEHMFVTIQRAANAYRRKDPS